MALIKQNNRKSRDLPTINERIRFPEIRVIDANGDQLGIMTPADALEIAEEREVDLVLISDKADPPVCRIMDYGKYKFEQEKKAREARKKQHTSDVKEVKMRYKIGDHDYNVRRNQAERFLKSGDKVKATVMFRGREIQHTDLAEILLNRLAADLGELAELQQAPKREGRNIMMMLSPKKTTWYRRRRAAFAAQTPMWRQRSYAITNSSSGLPPIQSGWTIYSEETTSDLPCWTNAW